MAKRRIRFELSEIRIAGIKLEIDDDLDAATAAFGAAQQLIAGAIQPAFAQALVKGQGKIIEAQTASADIESPKLPPSKSTRPSRRAKGLNNGESTPVPTLSHDPDKYGNPHMDWTTAQKALWTLWVMQDSTDLAEMGPSQIVGVFNKYFREFRTINRQNVTRDLGKERKKIPPTVGFNPDSGVWFLYEPGKTAAKALAHPTTPSE